MLKINKKLLSVASIVACTIAPPSFAEWQELENISLTQSRQIYDRANAQFVSNVSVYNNSDTALEGPLRLVISNNTMAVANMDGNTESGEAYFTIEGLEPGESVSLRVGFEFARARLSFDLSLQQELDDSDWTLVWSDEFEGNEIDLSKWSHEENCWGGGNNEQQCYTNRGVNSFLDNGVLNIVAQREDFTGPDNPDGNLDSVTTLPYTSARLRSLNKGDWTYGRFEISAKMPYGQGTWPAIWMLPTDYVYGGWAASGEIDIMEAVNLKTQSDAPDAAEGDLENEIHGTLHFGQSWPGNVSAGTHYELANELNPADGFHEYAIEWEEGEIRWYVDDLHYATQTSDGWYAHYINEEGVLVAGEGAAPFNERFHMLINFAVGGNWAANVNEGGIDESAFPQTMQVDYVRVYECSVNPTNGQGCASIGDDFESVPGVEEPVLADPDSEFGSGPVFNLFIDELAEGLEFGSYNPNGSVSFSVVEEDDRGNVIMFEQSGTLGNMFLNAPSFSMNHFAEYGQLSFDLKVIDNSAGASVLVKIDSGWPNVSDYSVELPEQGEWQTITIGLANMLANGNSIAPGNFADILNVTNPFVLEPNNPISLAIDNIRYQYNVENINEVVVFDEADHPPFAIGKYVANGSVDIELIDSGTDNGMVQQVTWNTNESVVYFQTMLQADSSTLKLDMTNKDTLEFDLYVVEDDRDNRDYIIKMDCGFPCGTGDYPIETPDIGVWTSYSIPLANLVSHPGSSLDLSSVDTPLVFFPAWGNQQGVVLQVDNVKVIGDGNNDNNPPTEIVVDSALQIFDDALDLNWSIWDCCGNAALSYADDAQRGPVINVDFFGPAPTVSGLLANLPHDVSGISSGSLSFDLKLVSPSNDATADYLIKFEGSDGSFFEVPLSTSNEGIAPVVGEWQTYTFDLADININLEKLKLILIFPSWDRAQGAVYQLDNVVLND